MTRFSSAPAPELCRLKALTQQHQEQLAQGDRGPRIPGRAIHAGRAAPGHWGWGRGEKEGTSCTVHSHLQGPCFEGKAHTLHPTLHSYSSPDILLL